MTCFQFATLSHRFTRAVTLHPAPASHGLCKGFISIHSFVLEQSSRFFIALLFTTLFPVLNRFSERCSSCLYSPHLQLELSCFPRIKLIKNA